MLFPIGLSTRLKMKQWFSLGLGLVSIILFVCIQDSKNLDKEIRQLHKSSMESKVVSKLYLEYCIRRVVDRKHCIFSKPFFHLKQKKRILDKQERGDFSEVIQDMGENYQGTKHYVEFYKKLMGTDSEIKKLPSFNEFEKEQEKLLLKAKEIHKRFLVLSHGNNNLIAIVFSILFSFSFIHLIWNTVMIAVLGRYLEKYIGGTFFLMLYFLTSGIVLLSYASSLPTDSIQYIYGSTTAISILMGFFYVVFFQYRMKFVFWKVSSYSIIDLRVKYIIPTFYLIQELLLPVFTSVNTPHRAHFFGAIAGLILGKFVQVKKKLPKGFLFQSELDEWNWLKLKRKEDRELFLNGSCQLLQNNRHNFTVRSEVVIHILLCLEAGEDIKFYVHYLDRLLPKYFAQRKNSVDSLEESLRVLACLPKDLSYYKYLSQLRKKSIANLYHFAEKENHHIQAIKIFQVLLEKYPRIKESDQLEMTFRKIIELNLDDNEFLEALKVISNTSTSIRVRDLSIGYLKSR